MSRRSRKYSAQSLSSTHSVHRLKLSIDPREGESLSATDVPTKIAPFDGRSPSSGQSLSLFLLRACGVRSAEVAFHLGPRDKREKQPPPPGAPSPPPRARRDGARGRVSSPGPPAHDIRRPPRDRCTRTRVHFASDSKPPAAACTPRGTAHPHVASSRGRTHATANVARKPRHVSPINFLD